MTATRESFLTRLRGPNALGTLFHQRRVITTHAKADRQASGGSRYVYLIMLLQRTGFELRFHAPNKHIIALVDKIQRITAYHISHIEIPSATAIGTGLNMPHPKNITINSSAKIGAMCTIFHNVTIGSSDKDPNAAPTIGNKVFIGAGAVILGSIIIGDGARIGANAVVTKSVPSGVTVIGMNQHLDQ